MKFYHHICKQCFFTDFCLFFFISRVVRSVEDNSFLTVDQPDILQSVYLVDLWQDKSIKDFSCVCYVQKVLKLSLKCICEMCGSVIIEDCSNTLCHSDEYRFVTRMR